ncbi:hypothetical protein [Streptomyces sp. B1I3]|uniref:hypothetical protein n=1 Tax=Streptomyces sp. B1I3 TaxID=3042264 RepID=UPI002782B2CE|nr:hypothetical protein [Streptomyces sp. B1I3]MDQ0796786.1 hypothetical protein [Streptomyces sp. B1I3]
MSTERPENDVTATRRRSPYAVASVAAAVLLAGGGGAYWATTASGDPGPGTGRSAPADSRAPLLSLDLPADSPSAPPQGIAPGEPDPHGSGVVYRAAGDLPDGPGTAAVHRASGTVTAAEVARLAKALGVRGTPHTDGTAWKVGSDGDGSGPLLRVTEQAPGSWTFARYASGGTDDCASVAACDKPGRSTESGSPVGEKAAEAAAAPVLEAVGQEDAALDARGLMGSVRVVDADPVVGGLPTYGWSTGIQVGPGGEIVGGSGQLKGLHKSHSYPVVGADDALRQLNAENRHGAKSGIGGCAAPVPLEGDLTAPGTGCASADGKRPATTLTVEKAVLGLAPRRSDGEQVLVPSWLFSVRPEGGGPQETVVRVAVDPDHLAKEETRPTPEPTQDPQGEGASLIGYSADGRTLEVTFWGGVCGEYTAHATESGSTVRVTVTASKPDPEEVCIMIAETQTRTVTLDAPLDGRAVVDGTSGAAVPRG